MFSLLLNRPLDSAITFTDEDVSIVVSVGFTESQARYALKKCEDIGMR